MQRCLQLISVRNTQLNSIDARISYRKNQVAKAINSFIYGDDFITHKARSGTIAIVFQPDLHKSLWEIKKNREGGS